MFTPSRDFKLAETGVFWDTGDCPIPKGISPLLICKNIQTALAYKGYVGKLSITAYSDMEQDTADFESSGITLLRRGDRHKRRVSIMEDFMLWAYDLHCKPFNLMIISRDILNDNVFLDCFTYWNNRNGNILLAQPESEAKALSEWLVRHGNDLFGWANDMWDWESLSLYGGETILNISWDPPLDSPNGSDMKNIKLVESSSSTTTHGIFSPMEIPIPTKTDYKDWTVNPPLDGPNGWDMKNIKLVESSSSTTTHGIFSPMEIPIPTKTDYKDWTVNPPLDGPNGWENFNYPEIENDMKKNIKSSSSTHGIFSPMEIPIPTKTDYEVTEIGVFWDTGDCPIPKGISPRMIFKNIQTALANKGFVGTLSITAYSDMEQDTADFESSGITLLRTGDKKDRLRKILDKMMDWAHDQNPKPFNLMLISEDSQEDLYIDTLLFWNARGGNILLAQPRILSDDLAAYGIVREFWFWGSLSLGLDPISHRRLSKIIRRSLLRSHIAAKKLAAKTKKLAASTSRSALAPVNNKNIQVQGKTRVRRKGASFFEPLEQ